MINRLGFSIRGGFINNLLAVSVQIFLAGF